MREEQEKKNKRIAAFTTAGVNILVLLILLFVVAWRAPNPPLPEYGIELNFGMDNQGSGDIQPRTPVGTQGTSQEQPEQSEPEPTQPEPEPESDTEAATPVETKPVEEQVVSKVESPVAVKEEKKEEKKPVEKPAEKPAEKPIETKKEEVKPTVDPKAVYKPNTSTSTSDNKTTSDASKEGEKGSQGDDKNKTGDKGNPQGTLDAKALYGKPGGGGGGPSLDLAGWEWDDIPRPEVPNNETGRIEFEIEVNEDGEIVRFSTTEKSVSAEAERACRAAIERLTFSKKPGATVPPITKGKITFVIRAK